MMSLSWGAARAFMVMRSKDEAETNPSIFALIIVWPYMMASVIANLVLLVCTGGILGRYIFPCLGLNFLIVRSVLMKRIKQLRGRSVSRGAASVTRKQATGIAIINETNPGDDPERNTVVSLENKVVESSTHQREGDTDPEVDKDVENLNQDNDLANNDDDTSLTTASLCALWIPCVVGKSSSRIFLTTAFTSLVTKVVILTVAICLCATDLQHYLHKRPFLPLCRDENSTLLDAANVTKCSFTDKKYIYCLSYGADEALSLSKMASSLSKMEQDLQSYSAELNKLRQIDLKTIQVRGVSQNELSRLKEEITKTELDNQREANIQNIKILMGEVDEELQSYGIGEGTIQQKVRVCEPNESDLRLLFLFGLFLAVLLASLSIAQLHRLTDHKEIFKRYL